MALTKKQLKAMGIDDDKADLIMEGHIESIQALQNKVASLEDKISKPGTDAAMNGSNPTAKNSDGEDAKYKEKYDALKKSFDDYKKEVAAKDERTTKTAAYRDLLKQAGISEKRHEAILKVSDIDSVKLNDKGEIEGAAELVKSLKTEWADFVASTETVPVKTPTPPANTGGTVKTRADVYKTDEHGRFLLDASQRQAELAKIIASEQKG